MKGGPIVNDIRREARSGRRLADPRARRARTITKLRGQRLWSTVLRVSRAPDGPVMELRQRPWTAAVLPVSYGTAGLILAVGGPPLSLSDVVFIASGVTGIVALRMLRRRIRLCAGPDGLTVRSTLRGTKTFAWSEVGMVRVTVPWNSLTDVMVVTVDRGADQPYSVKLRAVPMWTARPLARVFLATCHRYGAPGSYRRYGIREFWMGERPVYDSDERYLRERRPSATPADQAQR